MYYLKICITCLLLLITGSISTQAESKKLIKIGVILPLSSDMAAVGSACRDAALMAAKDAPALSKYKYEIKIEDDKLTPGEVAKAAQKLINFDKVSGIVSTWSYGGSIVAPIAERAKIPHIGVAWDSSIAKGEYNFLHLAPPSEFMSRFLKAFQKLGIKRVALLGIQESGSIFALDEFVRMAPSYGISITYRDEVLWTTIDFAPYVTKIAQSKPEFLLFNLGGDAMPAGLLSDLKKQQVNFKTTAVTSFDILSDLRPIEGQWYVSDSYLQDDFQNKFHSTYGHTISYGVGNFYEAIRLFISAYEKSKDGLPDQAKDQLLDVHELPSIFGPTSVDREGIFSYPTQYVQIKNGKRVPINLEEISE